MIKAPGVVLAHYTGGRPRLGRWWRQQANRLFSMGKPHGGDGAVDVCFGHEATKLACDAGGLSVKALDHAVVEVDPDKSPCSSGRHRATV